MQEAGFQATNAFTGNVFIVFIFWDKRLRFTKLQVCVCVCFYYFVGNKLLNFVF